MGFEPLDRCKRLCQPEIVPGDVLSWGERIQVRASVNTLMIAPCVSFTKRSTPPTICPGLGNTDADSSSVALAKVDHLLDPD